MSIVSKFDQGNNIWFGVSLFLNIFFFFLPYILSYVWIKGGLSWIFSYILLESFWEILRWDSYHSAFDLFSLGEKNFQIENFLERFLAKTESIKLKINYSSFFN